MRLSAAGLGRPRNAVEGRVTGGRIVGSVDPRAARSGGSAVLLEP
ncbi:hypothetical protein ACFEMC_20380 [Kineococcus sp. DHX-1]